MVHIGGDNMTSENSNNEKSWDDLGMELTEIYQCGACSGFHPDLNRAHDCCSEEFKEEMDKMPETTVWKGTIVASDEIRVPYNIEEIRQKDFREGMSTLMGHIAEGGLSAVHYKGDESPTFVPSERITTKCPNCGELIIGFSGDVP